MDYDPQAKAWSLMTKSHKGVVSVIRDLTLADARQLYERLDPWYGHHSTQHSIHRDYLKPGVFGAVSGGAGRSVSDGDIEVREVFGPPGWDRTEVDAWGGEWPKITTIWCDDKWEPIDPQPELREAS